MQYILLSLLMTAVQIPGATFQIARKILVDAGYRAEVIKTIDPHTRSFWEDEWESFGKKEKAFFSWSTRNKLGQFLLMPTLRNVTCRPSSFAKRYHERAENLYRKPFHWAPWTHSFPHFGLLVVLAHASRNHESGKNEVPD